MHVPLEHMRTFGCRSLLLLHFVWRFVFDSFPNRCCRCFQAHTLTRTHICKPFAFLSSFVRFFFIVAIARWCFFCPVFFFVSSVGIIFPKSQDNLSMIRFILKIQRTHSMPVQFGGLCVCAVYFSFAKHKENNGWDLTNLIFVVRLIHSFIHCVQWFHAIRLRLCTRSHWWIHTAQCVVFSSALRRMEVIFLRNQILCVFSPNFRSFLFHWFVKIQLMNVLCWGRMRLKSESTNTCERFQVLWLGHI